MNVRNYLCVLSLWYQTLYGVFQVDLAGTERKGDLVSLFKEKMEQFRYPSHFPSLFLLLVFFYELCHSLLFSSSSFRSSVAKKKRRSNTNEAIAVDSHLPKPEETVSHHEAIGCILSPSPFLALCLSLILSECLLFWSFSSFSLSVSSGEWVFPPFVWRFEPKVIIIKWAHPHPPWDEGIPLLSSFIFDVCLNACLKVDLDPQGDEKKPELIVKFFSKIEELRYELSLSLSHTLSISLSILSHDLASLRIYPILWMLAGN